MATKIYQEELIVLMDGSYVEAAPLKLKYLREFMDTFQFVKSATDDNSAIFFLTECAAVAMKQYRPELSNAYLLEDVVDLDTIYKIIEVAAGIKMSGSDDDDTPVADNAKESEKQSDSGSWEKVDLLKLESEVFLLGAWKNYDDLEASLSMTELLAILNTRREIDYNDKKFNAGIQGVDLGSSGTKEEDPWEAMKSRVASKVSGIDVKDSNDITSFQGIKAQQTGFGIGMGIEYGSSLGSD